MANSLTQFNLIYFAQEALMTLHDKLGLAARVHRGFSNEPGFRGKTIRIAKPATPAVNVFGTGSADVTTGGTDLVLDQHYETHIKFTDAELMYSSPGSLLNTHVRPSIQALAGAIDTDIAELYKFVPWAVDVNTTAGSERKNVTQPRKILAANGVNVEDFGNMFLATDEIEDARFRESTMFDSQTTGESAAEMMQLQGASLIYQGIGIFRSGKIQTHTSGTVITGGNDIAGAANADGAVGATSLAIDGLSGSETILAGDSFVFANHSQRYVATATTTLGTGAGTVSFFPALVAAVPENTVVTFEAGASTNAGNFYANMMFHRHAFALGMAPLSNDQASAQARAQGWQVENVVDPDTNLGLRAMVWYDGTGVNLRFDALWGAVCLDPNMAVRLRGDV
jgi:hypothetical protein